MIIQHPAPVTEAVTTLQKRRILQTTLKAAELEKIAADIKRASTFAAQVNHAHYLKRVQDMVDELVSPKNRKPGEYLNKARFREEATAYLKSIGYAPEPGKEGSIEDLLSEGRQNLMADTLTQTAQGYGQFVQGNTAVALDAFPAWELVRVELKTKPRPWPQMWRDAGGKFTRDGRMIALKDDPLWLKSIEDGGFNRFGNPYAPFDYNSGMRTRDVSREVAVGYGLIGWDDKVKPRDAKLFDGMQAGVTGFSKALQDALLKSLGPGYRINDGVLEAG